MSLNDTILLLGIVAFASYAQTVTGFAFGLIVMAGVVLLDLVPVATVAILISLLTLVNAGTALFRNADAVHWRLVLLCAASGWAMLSVGVWLLGYLSGERVMLLRLLLGGAIVISSVMLVLRPSRRERPSHPVVFLLYAAVSGLMGGLFSTAGPPLVYHFHRQPLDHRVIRDTLLSIFAMNSAVRLCIVGVQGAIGAEVLLMAAKAAPVVLLFTWLARRYPPRLSVTARQRIAFVLLFAAGISLMGPALHGVPALLAGLAGR